MSAAHTAAQPPRVEGDYLFVRRPIVAIVISFVTVLVGAVAMRGLPIAALPNVVPPQIVVNTTYTGADAIAIEQSVATPIEQQMNGVDNMLYVQSTNSNDGGMSLTVTFDVGTDIDTDNVLTQNRLDQAQPQLPADVRTFGLTTVKSMGLPLLVFSLYSPKGTYDAEFLGNYGIIQLTDALLRARRGPDPQLRRLELRTAHLGQARSAHAARSHGARSGAGAAEAERRESGRTDRRGAGAARSGADVQRARAGPAQRHGGLRLGGRALSTRLQRSPRASPRSWRRSFSRSCWWSSSSTCSCRAGAPR